MRGRAGLERSGKRGAERMIGIARLLTLTLSRRRTGYRALRGESYFFSPPVAAALRAPLCPVVPSKKLLPSPSCALGWQAGVQE
jgi:hypothetical protein